MYALVPTDCADFAHAKVLRSMLEADGFPAVAVEVTAKGKVMAFVFSSTPPGYLTDGSYVALSLVFSIHEDMEKLCAEKVRLFGEDPDAVPKATRDKVRQGLLETVKYAVDKTLPGNSLVTEPAIPSNTEGHDPGDEHSTPDAWDNWKPGRDCNIVNGHCTVH